MKEKYVFLTSVSDTECNLIAQRLKRAEIDYVIKDYPQNTPFRIYLAHSFQGKKIYVPISQFKKSKELLNIKDKNFSFDNWKISKIVRIMLFFALIIWILLNIYVLFE